jgi:hypothetical protein
MSKPLETPKKRWANRVKPIPLWGGRKGIIADAEILSLLGTVCFRWAHAENAMIKIFGQLINASDHLHTPRLIFTAIINQRARIDVMRKLLEGSPYNNKKGSDYDHIITEFRKLNELRNSYVHGLWWTHENGTTYLQSDNSVFGLDENFRKVTAKELQEYLDRLNKWLGSVYFDH